MVVFTNEVNFLHKELGIDVRRFVETFENLTRSERRKQPLIGLKQSEVRVLLCIEQLAQDGKNVVKVSEISRKLCVTSPTVTELIKSLSTQGYIEKSTDSRDKRVVDIKLTDKGEKVVQKVTIYFKDLFSGLIERLGEKQSEVLLELLDQVCKYLDETNIEMN